MTWKSSFGCSVWFPLFEAVVVVLVNVGEDVRIFVESLWICSRVLLRLKIPFVATEIGVTCMDL